MDPRIGPKHLDLSLCVKSFEIVQLASLGIFKPLLQLSTFLNRRFFVVILVLRVIAKLHFPES